MTVLSVTNPVTCYGGGDKQNLQGLSADAVRSGLARSRGGFISRAPGLADTGGSVDHSAGVLTRETVESSNPPAARPAMVRVGHFLRAAR